MFRASANIDVDVTTRSRGTGGLMSGIKRMLAGESFFFSTYKTLDGRRGEIGLAPTLAGEVAVIECSGRNTQFQGLRGMFSGESLSFLSVEGQGELLVSAFGSIREIEVNGDLTVDTGHVVAFEESLDYTLGRAGGSWIQSMLASEGVVLNFSGNGRLYVQSHNPDEFGSRLGGLMPPREN